MPDFHLKCSKHHHHGYGASSLLQVDERSWGELPEAERLAEPCAGRHELRGWGLGGDWLGWLGVGWVGGWGVRGINTSKSSILNHFDGIFHQQKPSRDGGSPISGKHFAHLVQG